MQPNKIFLLGSLFFLGLTAVCCQSPSTTTNNGNQNDDMKAVFGEELYTLMTEPEQMAVYLLNGWEHDRSTTGFAGFKVVDKVENVGQVNRKYIISLLENKESYLSSPSKKKCEFVPNIGIAFKKGGRSGQALFSLSCEVMKTSLSTGAMKKPLDIDPSSGQFENIFSLLFPTYDILAASASKLRDPQIQEEEGEEEGMEEDAQEMQVAGNNNNEEEETGQEERNEEQSTQTRIEYKVKSGDTLYKIARTHDVSVADLKRWNNLSDDNIRKGQKLVINQ